MTQSRARADRRASAPARAAAAIRKRAAAFLADRRGAAAVEFAFLAPLLISMYFLSMEVSQAVETSKKVSRIGSMVADLVTQQPKISASELDAILKIGGAILQPYDRSDPTITLTGIEITTDSPPKVKVVWSRKLEKGATSEAEAPGTETEVPEKLEVAGTFLVRAESRLLYSPVIAWAAEDKEPLGLTAAFDSIDMGDSYFLRPRMSDTVACDDC